MYEEQNEMQLKDIGLFGGVVVLTSIVVILLYGWLYGFKELGHFSADAKGATAAGFIQRNSPPLHQQMAYPYGAYNQVAAPAGQYGYPAAQGGSAQYGYSAGGMGQTALAGQYFCPQHGAVGTPAFAPGGLPQCPLCGKMMGFNRHQAGSQFAVGGGGNPYYP